MLYHITTAASWVKAQREGSVSIPDPSEGFVHCSWRHQVLPVAAAFYDGRTDLVLLQVDPGAVKEALVEEDLNGAGEAFPHVYGAIPVSAIVAASPFAPNERGEFSLPEGP